MRAILLDCLGTLLRLHPPAPRLDAPLPLAERAFAAEIAFYRAHMDALPADELRRRCAEVLSDELGRTVTVDELLACLVFEPFPDVVPFLASRSERLVVVSNWDASLPEVLGRTGLLPYLDGVVTSGGLGVGKPDPRPVLEGLRIAGVEAADALMVGDSPEDAQAAAAAGVECVLLDRPHRTLAALP
jgi:HAD superfamily hydrolase (TIGR01509 family)